MRISDYVDTIIGTVGDEQETSMHGGGKTHPGATCPFGMVQLSPDTTTSGDNGTGYNYCQNTIEGFSFNHMSGIGWYGDLGNIQVMPVCSDTDLRSGSNDEVSFTKGRLGWKSPFKHENEITEAGYYSVYLDRYLVKCEASATLHCGILRFLFDTCIDNRLIINLSRRIAGHVDLEQVKIIDNSTLEGKLTCTKNGGGFGRGNGGIGYNLYFRIELSCNFKEAIAFENEEFLPVCDKYEGTDLHLLLKFGSNDKITLKCGISYTSIEGARDNLQREIESFDFDKIKVYAKNSWDKALSTIKIEGENETDKTLFYTCLYHTMLDPRVHSDACDKGSFTRRTMFSGWDVYRSQFPLLTITNPKCVSDTVSTLIEIGVKNNSSLPKWELMGIDSGCMVGDSGLIVMADAYLKGICDFDINKGYEICVSSKKSKSTLWNKEFKSVCPKDKCYLEGGYVKNDISSTLELLLADYCMANLSKMLGYVSDFEYFKSRYKGYYSNYNSHLGFMCPRDENGEFYPIKDRYDYFGCVESNIFQQSFFVPYDVCGLAELFGKDRFISLLEELFSKSDFSRLWNEDYNHSNEPCHNLTHYYNPLGLYDRTQYWTRRVQKEAYRLGAFGFCGNEDVGQLSAWYVLSAIGFAQICPTDNKYYINTPLFKSISLNLDKRYHKCNISSTLEIKCDKNPDEFLYISSVYFNGKRLSVPYLTYEQITGGGVVEFNLSDKPENTFGE